MEGFGDRPGLDFVERRRGTQTQLFQRQTAPVIGADDKVAEALR